MNNKLPALFLTGLSVVVPNVAVSDQFSIAIIPDTQMLVEQNPHVFFAQMDWIVRNKDTLDIVYVAHLGDLKDDQSCDVKTNIRNPETISTLTDEWTLVDWGFKKLDKAGIPYGVVPGNHDYEQTAANGCLSGEPSNPQDRDLTSYDGLFGPGVTRGVSQMDKKPWYGDFSASERGNRLVGSNDDNFTLFGRCGVNFIAINLGYRSLGYLDNGNASCTTGADPFANCELRDGGGVTQTATEIHWVDDLLTTYSDRLAIVTSHYLVDSNSGQSVANRNQFGGYGEQLYHFIKGHPNLFMMLSAHEFGEAWRTETRTNDASGFDPDLPAVQAMLSDYQQVNYPAGATTSAQFSNLSTTSAGDGGFMRLLTFDTVTREVTIKTFSPGQVRIRDVNDATPLDDTDPGSYTVLRQDDLDSAFNPQTVLYANAGNSMNDGTASSEFKIRYDGGYVPAMAINCATTKSQPLQLGNGAYDVSSFDSATANIQSVGTSADFNSSYGYYVTDADGNPASGQIIHANVKVASAAPVQVDLSGVDGAALLGFFIIPNGASLNSSALLTNGAAVTFTQIGANWVPRIGTTNLSGTGAPAFYSTAGLNAGGVQYMTGDETFQGWEDLVGGGDLDFNDVTVTLSNSTGNSH